jgi:hypothetical protein
MIDWVGVAVGLLVGALLSWLVAHIYYKKSEGDLKAGFAEQLAMLKAIHEAHLGDIAGAKEAVAAERYEQWQIVGPP